MLSKGHYFPNQGKEEQIVLFIKRHWLSFMPWMIFIGLMMTTPIVMFFALRDVIIQSFDGPDRIYLIIGFSSYLLIAFAVFLTAWISYYLNVAIITPEHLVDIRQSGLFNRKVSEQSLLRVQDVSAHMSGFFQTIFNYGTVNVETAGEAPNFTMPSIPNPSHVTNTILKLHEELVKRSGYDQQDLAEGIGLESHKDKNDHIEESSPNQYRHEKKETPNEMLQGFHRDIAENTMTEGDSWFDGVKMEKKVEILPKKSKNEEKTDDKENEKQTNPKEEKKISLPKKEELADRQKKSKIYDFSKLSITANHAKEGELNEGEVIQL